MTPVTIAPAKTAVVIVDMQNFFLSSALGRSKDSEGLDAEEALLKYVIPRARRLVIQLVWVNWGITDSGLASIPPTVWRNFGYDDDVKEEIHVGESKFFNKERKTDGGLGDLMGKVKLDDGSSVDAGRMLMRDQWNTELHAPLARAFNEGANSKVPDVWFHKERISGLWGSSGDLERFLEKQGITTLLFGGVNTDQCVLATLQDANNKGYDTILLEDACGTTSPDFTRKMVHFNCQSTWGFVSSGKALHDAILQVEP